MTTQVTKSDFLRYLDCPAYLWFYKKKPEVLTDQELSDFQLQLIKQGEEVEGWARKIFPNGVLVESREAAAVEETQKLLDQGEKTIFQATFKAEDLYAMVDILEWDEANQYWIINEVKGTSSQEEKKIRHLQDATFQYVLLKKAGYNAGRVNLIELDKEFRKNGEIIARKLLKITDITDKATEMEQEINLMVEDMKRVMEREAEPLPCECIYKSRANHCPAFKYLHPDVPDYSVHDIVRIGLSLPRLEGLIENDYISLEDVPEDFALTKYQRNHVDVEQSKIPIIRTEDIKNELDKLEFPLYFLDYETIPTAVPLYDGCKPYQQVPFQYSLHVQQSPNAELEHFEYIHTNNDTHPMTALAESLMKVMGDKGSIIVWNKKFESKCHEDLADFMPEKAEIFHSYNKRIYDLMDIFSQHLYLHPDFRGSFSIKAVLPVLVPSLSYKEMAIHDGAMAMNSWKKMMFETEDQAARDKIRDDLLKYCDLDTLAMVEIYRKLTLARI